MKKYFFVLGMIFCLMSCESIPDEPACWECQFTTSDETWYETFCDMTHSEILDYEDQVFYETGGEIDVNCYYQK